ncbi:unnamed protein product, partial [marine sediment metagenome]
MGPGAGGDGGFIRLTAGNAGGGFGGASTGTNGYIEFKVGTTTVGKFITDKSGLQFDDNIKTIYGTGENASITFDGANLIIEAKNPFFRQNATINGTLTGQTEVNTIKNVDFTDPTFDSTGDWTNGTGWNVSDGEGVKAGGSATTTIEPATAVTPIVGKNYKISIDITDEGGFVWTLTCGGFSQLENQPGSGTFTFVFTATNTDNMILEASGGAGGPGFDLTTDNWVLEEMGEAQFGTTEVIDLNVLRNLTSAGYGASGPAPQFFYDDANDDMV